MVHIRGLGPKIHALEGPRVTSGLRGISIDELDLDVFC